MKFFALGPCFAALAERLAREVRAPVRRFTCMVVTGLALFAGAARSALVAPGQETLVIPIRIIDTNAGRVMTVSSEQYGDKVYIRGLVYRPSSPSIGPHVHVWGVDAKQHTIFSKTTSVLVTGKPSFIQTEPYVVSVDPSVFEKAKVIFVTFHSQADAESRDKN